MVDHIDDIDAVKYLMDKVLGNHDVTPGL